jgi:low temperature requirement protein LtrA
VLAREPEFMDLPPSVPPRLKAALARCLDKNPKRRWQAIGDVRMELEQIAADPTAGVMPTVASTAPRSLTALVSTAVAAAVIAAACSAGIWWVHFDLASLMIQRDLVAATPGREQNELARDVYSLLHLVLVAGIVLLAYGLKETLHDIDAPLPTDGTGALLGGIALYLLGHVAVGLRASHRVKRQRLVVAVLLLALVPVVHDLDAIWVLAIATALLWAMVAFETTRYAQVRDDVRHVGRAGPPA